MKRYIAGLEKDVICAECNWKMMAENSAQKNAELSTIMLIKKGAYQNMEFKEFTKELSGGRVEG